MVFGFMKKRLGAAAAEAKKFDKKDLMEATIGAAFLVAGADGELETSEMDKLEKVIRNTPSLSQFGQEITETINRFKRLVQESGMRHAKLQIMREINDIKADPKECEDVFVTAITIAEADGQIEPEEQKVLGEIARKLNLNPADFDLHVG